MKRKTFDRLVTEQRQRLLKVATNLVGEHAAPDVVQSALEAVFKDGQWRDGVRDLKRWLTTAVQNAAKMNLRSAEFEHNHVAEFVARLPQDEAERDAAIDVRHAFAKLPDEIRAAVYAVVIEGATEREHAQEVGVSQPVVHKRVQRGLALLREGLSDASSAASQEVRSDDEEVA